jgi:hypothetical protein
MFLGSKLKFIVPIFAAVEEILIIVSLPDGR